MKFLEGREALDLEPIRDVHTVTTKSQTGGRYVQGSLAWAWGPLNFRNNNNKCVLKKRKIKVCVSCS